MPDRVGRSVEVLLHGPAVASMRPRIEEAYATAAWWEQADASAFLAHHGPSIRAIVADGSLPIAHSLLQDLPGLSLVACVGSGFEAMDLAYLKARGVAVTHAPGLNSGDVADFAVLLLLAQARGLNAGQELFWSGQWGHRRAERRRSIQALKVGIVGLGAIGAAVAARLEAFGCRMSWWGPRDKPSVAWPRLASLSDLARASDALILTLRADEKTRGVIDASVIEDLGPDGIIVNVARGSVLDEDALMAALREGRLAGAALDVYGQEPADPRRWRDVPNLLATPHMAAATNESLNAMVGALMENLRRAFAGEPPFSPVPESP